MKRNTSLTLNYIFVCAMFVLFKPFPISNTKKMRRKSKSDWMNDYFSCYKSSIKNQID